MKKGLIGSIKELIDGLMGSQTSQQHVPHSEVKKTTVEPPERNAVNPMDNAGSSVIKVYGTTWCGSSRRACQFLDEHAIKYQFIDIDKDLEARTFVEETNRGFRSVPTILFPDGSLLVEPSSQELASKCGY